jgi:HK97 family phage major capsid protein
MSFIKAQQELRANLVSQIREVTDFAEAEKRGLLAEEVSKIEKIEADIRSAEEAIGVAQRNEERMTAAADAGREFVPATESRSDADILRQIAAGELRSFDFSKRALVPSDNTVPKSFYDEVFQVARLVGPMLDVGQVINTTSGENLTIPTSDRILNRDHQGCWFSYFRFRADFQLDHSWRIQVLILGASSERTDL